MRPFASLLSLAGPRAPVQRAKGLKASIAASELAACYLGSRLATKTACQNTDQYLALSGIIFPALNVTFVRSYQFRLGLRLWHQRHLLAQLEGLANRDHRNCHSYQKIFYQALVQAVQSVHMFRLQPFRWHFLVRHRALRALHALRALSSALELSLCRSPSLCHLRFV